MGRPRTVGAHRAGHIRPDNAVSRRLVAQYGFVEVGEQWDDDDGLETIFDVHADRSVTRAIRTD